MPRFSRQAAFIVSFAFAGFALSAPTLAPPGGQFLIKLSTNQTAFTAPTGLAGVLEAVPPIEILVASRDQRWVVNCQASPLTRLGEGGGAIPSARLYLAGKHSLQCPDTGAGPGFLDLSEPRLVASREPGRGKPVQTDTLRLRLRTTWGDRPGQYRGEVHFVYLAVP